MIPFCIIIISDLLSGFRESAYLNYPPQTFQIAQSLREHRYEHGALTLNQTKLQYTLDRETGLPCGYSVYQQKESNK